MGSAESTFIKLTWRWVQSDHEGSGSRWRLTIALRCVEACDELKMGLLGRIVFESGEAFGPSLNNIKRISRLLSNKSPLRLRLYWHVLNDNFY
ncbi:unnamed protein product [Rodentolepis nana]|uniref:Uncharacterized protein n=1 Tax=Rodentolepis nana TaxID=102285 RepID=A0A0R3TKK9_RODNA|nr:unnamed protein product [Rodentolepis nana]